MNRFFLLVIMFVASCYTNAQVARTVELAEGDDIATLLGDDKYLIDSLSVNGFLSHDNFDVIQDCSYKGKLRKIDMSGCVIENDSIDGLGLGRWYVVRLPQKLKVIGRGAFLNYYGKTIEFPSTLRRIHAEAFYNSGALENIIIPEGVEEIGEFAFYNCRKAKRIQLPSTLKVIDNYAFAGVGCDVESELIFSEGELERIGNGAFMSMQTITELSLPSTVVSLGMGAFALSVNLKYLKLPENLETLKTEAFSKCCLEEIIWPEKLREIEYNAIGNLMMDCLELPEGLTKINDNAIISAKTEKLILPSTLTDLSYVSFCACTAIKEVYAKSPVPPILDMNGSALPFPKDAILYVPVGARDAYLSVFCHGEFKDIIEIENIPTLIDGVIKDDVAYSVCGENGAISIVSNSKTSVPYYIYTTDGKLYDKGLLAGGTIVVNVGKGVYVVKVGTNTERVIVR